MEKNRMQKLAGINEGTIFKNGKFEIPRWDTDYREGEPHYEMPKYGEWCKYDDVEKLEEIAGKMYGILNDLADIVHGADQMIVAKADVLQKAARDVIKKAKSL